ncbi:MAG TPA: polymer-forming cytoskeletal protein [Planctomycetaceae bacterium]
MTADAPRRGLSATNKVLIGCGLVMLLSLLLLCGGGVLLGRKAWNAVSGVLATVDEFVAEFEQKGYRRVAGQAITVTEPVEQPTVYKAQAVELKSDANADLAFAAQVVRIEGTVDGDVDFLGQVLEVAPGGHVTGDIRVKWGQVVNVQGRVDGTITGDVMQVQQPPAAPVPVEPANEGEPDSGPAIPAGPPVEAPRPAASAVE